MPPLDAPPPPEMPPQHWVANLPSNITLFLLLVASDLEYKHLLGLELFAGCGTTENIFGILFALYYLFAYTCNVFKHLSIMAKTANPNIQIFNNFNHAKRHFDKTQSPCELLECIRGIAKGDFFTDQSKRGETAFESWPEHYKLVESK